MRSNPQDLGLGFMRTMSDIVAGFSLTFSVLPLGMGLAGPRGPAPRGAAPGLLRQAAIVYAGTYGIMTGVALRYWFPAPLFFLAARLPVLRGGGGDGAAGLRRPLSRLAPARPAGRRRTRLPTRKAAYNAARERPERGAMTTPDPQPPAEDDAPTAQVRRPKNVAELDPPARLLLGPGPSPVHPRVMRALAAPALGHLDPALLELLAETSGLLRGVFRTSNKATLAVSGTGMAGMEAVLGSLLEPGDGLVVCSAGFFGNRIAELAARMGASVTRVEKEWGQVFTAEEVEAAVAPARPKAVAIVHAETSTGALQPMGGLGEIAHRHGALLIADCVTSLGRRARRDRRLGRRRRVLGVAEVPGRARRGWRPSRSARARARR